MAAATIERMNDRWMNGARWAVVLLAITGCKDSSEETDDTESDGIQLTAGETTGGGTGQKLDVGGGATDGIDCSEGLGNCNNLIDLLFIIDNSGSMGEEQLNLALNMPKLIHGIEDLTDADGNPVQPNVHIMVTTTDAGNVLCDPFYAPGRSPESGTPISSACTDRLERFTSISMPPVVAESACTTVCPSALAPDGPFIEFSAAGDNVPDVPPVDIDALLGALTAVSQLLAEVPEVAELDINPLLADARGVVALDARVRVDAACPGGAARFAIRPYPHELEESFDWDGRRVTLRPIRPEDEARHLAFLERLDPEDVRMRVFYSRRTIERSELARLTQIDYEREMAFVATAADADGAEETLGVVRAVADPDNVEAEFGIVVRSDLKGSGLGDRLMHKLIDYLKARGTRVLTAVVLAENRRMLSLARELGFTVGARTVDDTRDIRLPLVDVPVGDAAGDPPGRDGAGA